jgi:hypothetical protein
MIVLFSYFENKKKEKEEEILYVVWCGMVWYGMMWCDVV